MLTLHEGRLDVLEAACVHKFLKVHAGERTESTHPQSRDPDVLHECLGERKADADDNPRPQHARGKSCKLGLGKIARAESSRIALLAVLGLDF